MTPPGLLLMCFGVHVAIYGSPSLEGKALWGGAGTAFVLDSCGARIGGRLSFTRIEISDRLTVAEALSMDSTRLHQELNIIEMNDYGELHVTAYAALNAGTVTFNLRVE